MEIDLSGRTALVTGSTAGIGRATAIGLASAGAAVIVNGRSAKRTEQAAAEIGEAAGAPDRVRPLAADVGDAAGCDALIAAEPDVDVLVNNAGIFNPTPFFDIPDDDWQRHFDVNVMSGVRLSRHHTPRMVQRGWGRVIFISSESAIQMPTEMVHYGMTKTAQLAVSRGLAETVPATGVTVNTVMPGPTLSEGLERMLAEQVTDEKDIDQVGREFIASERPSSLLGRPAQPGEIANLIVYLASDLASATTGAALRADGGVLRAIA